MSESISSAGDNLVVKTVPAPVPDVVVQRNSKGIFETVASSVTSGEKPFRSGATRVDNVVPVLLGGLARPTPARASVPVWRLEARLDADKADKLDPLFPKAFPLWASAVEPLEFAGVRIAPTDTGISPASDLSLEAYEALVLAHGVEDVPAGSDTWLSEGTAAMRAVLEGKPSGSLAVWRGEDEVRLRMAESVGRAFGIGGASIAKVTGRPFISRRSMLTPLSIAKLLDARKVSDDAAAAQAKAEAEKVVAEAMRKPSLAELKIEVVSIAKNRIGVDTRPYADAFQLWEDEAHRYFGWASVLGLELEPLDPEPGVTVLGREHMADASLKGRTFPTSRFALAFIKERRSHMKGLQLGPITDWSDRGVEQAAALAKDSVRTWIDGQPQNAWMRQWVCEASVRGFLVRVDVAAALINSAIDDEVNRRANALQAHREGLNDAPLLATGEMRTYDPKLIPTDPMIREHPAGEVDAAKRGWKLSEQLRAPLSVGGSPEVGELCAKAAGGAVLGISAGSLLPNLKSGQKGKSK